MFDLIIRALPIRVFALVAALVFVAAPGRAEPLDAKAVPEPLKPWTAWALHGKVDGLCPTLHGVVGGAPQCVWPARLELDLDEKRGTFKQGWHVDARRSVPLPGDDKRWPLDVTVDGRRAVVVPRDGVPSVELEPGDHVVTGTFAWDSLPESLEVPPQTALLRLVLRGTPIDAPNRDARGTVWLQKTLAAQEGERLDFVVHRRLTDEVPMLLTTRIALNVAGQSREVLLGKALPPGFVPMALSSELPARVEPDTRLRVQLRPGTWTIELVARSEGVVAELGRPDPDGPWRDGEEVWVFDARTNLRLVEIEGVSAIDPQQTSLPDEWKRLPSYPVALGDKVRLVEKRRGDAEPPPDHLALERTLWLDFDGRGFTARDTLRGNLRRASRLEMLPPTVLGRVAIEGKDQFITHLEGDAARMGVEVRQGELVVSADSRVLARPSDLPAVGYNHDFHEVSATLNLPPGYRLLHATGVDDVPGTWIKHWTLLELFLALVLAIGAWRLFGARWGALALVTFGLVFPESQAPKFVFVFVLVVEALVRALDRARSRAGDAPGRALLVARKLGGVARGAGAIALVLFSVTFMIDHVRRGLFPAVDASAARSDASFFDRSAPMSASAAAPMTAEEIAGGAAMPSAAASATSESAPEPTADDVERLGAARALPKRSKVGGSRSTDYKQFNANVYDPTSMVQTGPGLPSWSFTQVPLRWSGPVERTQHLHLYLLSPTMNAALAVLRALVLAALVLRLVPVRPRRDRGKDGRSVLTFGAVAALALVLAPGIARADTAPSQEILDELARRMLDKPACAPTCASSSRMFLEATKNTLRLRVEIEASAATAVPLPGSAQWAPEDVLLDGRPARALLRTEDGHVWLAVDKGWHQATLEGRLPDRELVQIALPLKPHRVEVSAEGWRVDGVHEDGLADENVQLTRIHGAGGASSLEPGVLPPFVRVERTLLIGLDWQVATRVVRLSPPGAAIVLEVPLLEGESVTTADVRVAGGKAQLNMAPQAAEISWRSVLEPRSPIALTAPRAAGWTELWRLDMSPIWHAELAGIPVVHAEPGATLPEWRPWPGESATVKVSRPEGVAGSTLTIDESTYALRPGLRATDATLSMQIRSSRGTQHAITLPEGSVLESVTIDGVRSPVRQEGRKITLPIAPGAQRVEIAWRMPRAVQAVFAAPELDLGVPSVNATTTITMPTGRWVLALRGPSLGPVVLFWSLLGVLLAVFAAVGAMRKTPLAIWQWVLLAIGLSQVSVFAAAFVVAWFHLLAWRKTGELGVVAWNLRQLVIVFASVVAFFVLLTAVHKGLLGDPDMQVRGNGSYAGELRWFTDRAEGALPMPLVVSAPMFVYRVAMLAWALWLALSVVSWLRWGFGAFAEGGFWRRRPPSPPVTPPQWGPTPPGVGGPPGPPGPPGAPPAPRSS